MVDLSFRPAAFEPPNNLDAEEAVLGGILLDPNAIDRVAQTLKPESFYLGSHQEIYRACLALHEKSIPTDLVSVTGWLSSRGTLEKAGGTSKIAFLVDVTVSSVNIDFHAQLVQDRYLRRKMIQFGQEATQLGHHTAKELDDLFLELESRFIDLQTIHASETELTSTNDLLEETFAGIEQRAEQQVDPGINSGFIDVDRMTLGFQRSDLIFLGGRPAMGKSAFAAEALRYAAQRYPDRAFLFATLEMSKRQVMERLLSSMAQVELTRIKSGKLSEADWMKLSDAMIKIPRNMLIYDEPDLTVGDLRSKALQLKAKYGQLGMIVIDYLQLMETGGGENRTNELSKLTRSLKKLARKLNVPVIALCQVSRAVESRGDKRPTMADLRESGSIENDADLVMMLYRDEYYNPQTTDKGLAEVIIAKHRNGPTGMRHVLFDGRYTRFLNTPQRYEYA